MKGEITIALAGNPNSGKTTLFNELTGSHQYVGNWPGVTVEKKTGEYIKNANIKFTDLPGIYSLSPYTLEEVISRDYLLKGNPDLIINVVDGSNIERSLYLTTQLVELGIPVVIALNMIDVVRKNNDRIDTAKLEKALKVKIVEVSALKNENLDGLIEACVEIYKRQEEIQSPKIFSEKIEAYIQEIEDSVEAIKGKPAKRWLAVKLFEEDEILLKELQVSSSEKHRISEIVKQAGKEYDDDSEGIITEARYDYLTAMVAKLVKKGREGLTQSDRIDKIVTNRFLALPIFVVIMAAVYYISINIVGGPVTDWVNDVLIGEIIAGNIGSFLESIGTTEWLVSLLVDGIIGGVGGVVGFLPLIATLFFFIAILEDIGYMARIAFILDRVFRKFGLSGKSFIPILIGTGCSVPGIIGTRTIENDRDRRMTITLASMMPCGAKTDIIAMFAAVFGGVWWFGPLWYFAGIAAVVISGIMLKKTERFHGEPSPFIMELPEYHMPSPKNVFKATFSRCKAFLVKAGTIILLATVAIWFLQNITIDGQFASFADDGTDSVLSFLGKKIAWIFAPLGFGDWIAAVASVLGLIAKEVVVSTFGVLANLGEVDPDSSALSSFVASNFNTASMLSFMLFNQFTIPCFAAIGAIRQEMNSKKWTLFALGYIMAFSYTISLMVYQFGLIFIEGASFSIGTFVAIVVLICYLYLLFRPNKYKEDRLVLRSVTE